MENQDCSTPLTGTVKDSAITRVLAGCLLIVLAVMGALIWGEFMAPHIAAFVMFSAILSLTFYSVGRFGRNQSVLSKKVRCGRCHGSGRFESIWFLAASLVVVAGLNYYAPGNPTLLQRALGSSILLICAAPTWIWLRSDRGGFTGFFPLICGIYAMYFALPVFVLKHFHLHGGAFSLFGTEAQLIALLGVVALVVGYYSARRALPHIYLPKITRETQKGRSLGPFFVSLGALGLVGTVGQYLLAVPGGLQQPLILLSNLLLVSVLGIFALQLKGEASARTKLLAWGVFAPAFSIIPFLRGVSAPAIFLSIALVLVVTAVRKRIPWKGGTAAVGLILLVFFPLRNAVRIVGSGGGTSFTREVLSYGFIAEVANQLTQGLGENIQAGFHRINYLRTLSQVVDLTPENVSYWHGETYLPLFSKYVPRALWPGKPVENFGQVFGHRYGLIEVSDQTTSYNLHHLVEAFANFGTGGVWSVMLMLGAFYAILTTFRWSHQDESLYVGAGAFVLAGLLQVESNLSLILGGFLYRLGTIIIILVVWCVLMRVPMDGGLEPSKGAIDAKKDATETATNQSPRDL